MAVPTQAKWTIPFRPDEELSSDLQLTDDSKTSPPQLRRTHPNNTKSLPGNASVDLEPESLWTYLRASLLTTKLNTLAPHLWLVATQSSSSISPLHKQKILGREIILTDTTDLHLIWHYSRIFLKPLPRYLLSHAFWRFLCSPSPSSSSQPQSGSASGSASTSDQEVLLPSIIGFVRSYSYLIQSETDFRLAQSHHLVPSEINFESFSRFIKRFRELPDDMASPRFHFGELRLTRLNFWSGVFLRQRHYFNVARQYETYFERFFAPLLFAFGTLSVVLSAMQVALAAVAMAEMEGLGAWDRFVGVSKWTSVMAIIMVVAVVGWLVLVLVTKLLSELVYALGSLVRKRGRAGVNAV